MSRTRFAVLVLGVGLLAALPWLSGCDGLGDNDGRIRLLLTDAPAPEIAEVHVRITEVAAQAAGGQSVVLARGAGIPVDINLPALARRPLVLGQPKVPPGNYNAIRVTLSTVRGANWIRLAGGGTADLTLVNEVADARLATGAISVSRGKTTTVLLDFNGEASVHRIGGTWTLRPVVYASATEDPDPVPGSVVGRVRDSRGRPITPPANTILGVFLTGPLGPAAVGQVSSRDGAFAIPAALAGPYTLRVYYADLDWTPVGRPLRISVNGGEPNVGARVNLAEGRTFNAEITVVE